MEDRQYKNPLYDNYYNNIIPGIPECLKPHDIVLDGWSHSMGANICEAKSGRLFDVITCNCSVVTILSWNAGHASVDSESPAVD